jgi:hypothetical protein
MKFPDVGNGSSKGSQSNLFIRLKDGDRIKGIFKGDPFIYRLHWVGNRSIQCPGKEKCEHCAGGDKPKFRFKINFLTQEDSVWLAKIFEQGYGTFKDLKEMHENDYDLEKTQVVVSRSGEKQETRYRIMPAKENLKADEFKKIAAVPLNSLNDKVAEEPEQDANESDIPF